MSELKEEGRREREREKSRGLCPGGRGTCLLKPNGDVPLDGVALSKELLEWPHIYD